MLLCAALEKYHHDCGDNKEFLLPENWRRSRGAAGGREEKI